MASAMSYYYGRSGMTFGGGALTPAVKLLLIANVAIFLLEWVFDYGLIVHYFGVTPVLVLERGMLWQVVTYMFLHGGVWHLAFNMLWLWMFGCRIERAWGSRDFLKYYAVTGIGAGLATVILSPGSVAPTIGASGAIFGILMAYALMFPEDLVWIFGIIPLKAKHLVLIIGGIELLQTVQYSQSDGIGRFAHLGGMAVGYVYLKKGWRLSVFFERWRHRRARHHLRVIRRQEVEGENVREVVDAILDKIAREGAGSLTERERRTLDDASTFYRESG